MKVEFKYYKNKRWGLNMRYLMNIIFIFVCFIFSGCFTVSMLQTPKVLEEDKKEIGLGGGVILHYEGDGKDLLYFPEIVGNYRVGVGKDTDIGFRIFVLGAYVDIKHQFTKRYPYVSGVLGFSYSSFSEQTGVIGFYPSLIVGTDRFYTSAGAILVAGSVPDIFGGGSVEFGGLVRRLAVGYSFGSKLRITPEVGALLVGFTDVDIPWGFYYVLGISYRP